MKEFNNISFTDILSSQKKRIWQLLISIRILANSDRNNFQKNSRLHRPTIEEMWMFRSGRFYQNLFFVHKYNTTKYTHSYKKNGTTRLEKKSKGLPAETKKKNVLSTSVINAWYDTLMIHANECQVVVPFLQFGIFWVGWPTVRRRWGNAEGHIKSISNSGVGCVVIKVLLWFYLVLVLRILRKRSITTHSQRRR